MMSEPQTERTYSVNGRTAAGKFVTSSYCSSMKSAVTAFIEKYPRFKGNAVIETVMAQKIGNMIVSPYTGWETIDSFSSTTELKQYLGA